VELQQLLLSMAVLFAIVFYTYGARPGPGLPRR
jgi:hypothetical protein